jgi:hypothetical protein
MKWQDHQNVLHVLPLTESGGYWIDFLFEMWLFFDLLIRSLFEMVL